MYIAVFFIIFLFLADINFLSFNIFGLCQKYFFIYCFLKSSYNVACVETVVLRSSFFFYKIVMSSIFIFMYYLRYIRLCYLDLFRLEGPEIKYSIKLVSKTMPYPFVNSRLGLLYSRRVKTFNGKIRKELKWPYRSLSTGMSINTHLQQVFHSFLVDKCVSNILLSSTYGKLFWRSKPFKQYNNYPITDIKTPMYLIGFKHTY